MSLPFTPGGNKRIAVKIVDDRGVFRHHVRPGSAVFVRGNRGWRDAVE